MPPQECASGSFATLNRQEVRSDRYHGLERGVELRGFAVWGSAGAIAVSLLSLVALERDTYWSNRGGTPKMKVRGKRKSKPDNKTLRTCTERKLESLLRKNHIYIYMIEN